MADYPCGNKNVKIKLKMLLLLVLHTCKTLKKIKHTETENLTIPPIRNNDVVTRFYQHSGLRTGTRSIPTTSPEQLKRVLAFEYEISMVANL